MEIISNPINELAEGDWKRLNAKFALQGIKAWDNLEGRLLPYDLYVSLYAFYSWVNYTRLN